MTLDDYLNNCMVERYNPALRPGAEFDFLQAMGRDASLRQQAEERWTYLNSTEGNNIALRDHVTREFRSILKGVLGR